MRTKGLTLAIVAFLLVGVVAAGIYEPKWLIAFAAVPAALLAVLWLTGKDAWEPLAAEDIRRARRPIKALVLTVVVLAGVLVLSSGVAYDSPYFEITRVVVLFLFGSALIWLAYLLLFEREETRYGRWSVVVGASSVGAVVVSAMWLNVRVPQDGDGPAWVSYGSPVHVGLKGGRLRISDEDRKLLGNPGPGWFKIKHKATVSFTGTGQALSEEFFEIQPQSHFSIAKVSLPDSSGGDSVNTQYFVEGSQDSGLRRGAKTTIRQYVSLDSLSVGLIREKYTFSVPAPVLYVFDIDDTAATASDEERYIPVLLSEAGEVKSEVSLTLPRNSFLASQPSCPLNLLPDKDVITCVQEALPQNVEIYLLLRFRFGALRNLLSHSSETEAAGQLIIWIFWPIVLLLTGVFHKHIANKILQKLGHKPLPEGT